MLANLYYFEPCAAGGALQDLSKDYRLICIPRDGGKVPSLELPAVLLADAGEGDLARLEKSSPSPTPGALSASRTAMLILPPS